MRNVRPTLESAWSPPNANNEVPLLAVSITCIFGSLCQVLVKFDDLPLYPQVIKCKAGLFLGGPAQYGVMQFCKLTTGMLESAF